MAWTVNPARGAAPDRLERPSDPSAEPAASFRPAILQPPRGRGRKYGRGAGCGSRFASRPLENRRRARTFAPQPGAFPSERSAGTERRRGSPKAGKPLPPASQARGSPAGAVPARQAGRNGRRETGQRPTEAGHGPEAGRSEARISRLRGRARWFGRRNVKKAGSSVSEARKCRPAPEPGQGPRLPATEKCPESSW